MDQVIILDHLGNRRRVDVPRALLATHIPVSIRAKTEKEVGKTTLITKWGSNQVETPQTITHLFCKD